MKCNFSYLHYKEILEIALRSNYNFINFFEFINKDKFEKKDKFLNEKICILRHDIDYETEKIYSIAKIEYDLGINSTYFFQSCSKVYNSREKETVKIAKELFKMGHQIGVHLDLSWYQDISKQNILTYFNKEKTLLSNILDIDIIDIFSCHNPHKIKNFILDKTIQGVRHTYEPIFFSKIKYLSDSQGWYEGCICKIFKESKYYKIQLLTHPYIWDENPDKDFTHDMAKMISNKTKDLYDYTIKNHPICKKNKDELKNQIIRKINRQLGRL